jgi:hypothetical protein
MGKYTLPVAKVQIVLTQSEDGTAGKKKLQN